MNEEDHPMRDSRLGFRFLARRARRCFACACGAFLLLGSCASAGTVLQFGQINPSDHVRATDVAGVTTLSTTGNADGAGVSIPVKITNFLGVSGVNIHAFETYVGVHSVGAASSFAGLDIQSFTGTIKFTSLPGGAGADYLTATFSTVGSASNHLAGTIGGSGATLSATEPPAGLVLTSSFALFGGRTSMGIGYSNVSPFLTIAANGSTRSFTAENSGTFSASIIPEPSSITLGMISMISLLGFYYRPRHPTTLARPR
jgi:hypothetical protein